MRLKRFPAIRLLTAGALLLAVSSLAVPAVGEIRPRAGDAWRFGPPKKPAVPRVDNLERAIVNPIDAFVSHRLNQAGLSLSRRADKRVLLRRVTFDLTGLPPTPGEQLDFLEDESPDAYSKLVERLLASPAFGERWAQHWLDLVRYAETEGFKADRLRPNAFRYRDYVIDSFNSDRPYDEFVRQQVAGDQLEPDNPAALVATTFNRLYPDENNAANLFQRRQEILNDVTEITSLTFLGLTIGCARCHDHKFDDILQSDFYRLQAFFAPMTERDDLPAAEPEAVREYHDRQAQWEAATAGIRSEMDTFLSEPKEKANKFSLTKFRSEIRQCVQTPQAERTPLEQQIALMASKQLDSAFDPQSAVKKLPKREQAHYRKLESRLQAFDSLRPADLPRAMAVSDVGSEPPPTHVLDGGDWRSPLDRVEPGFPVAFSVSEHSSSKSPASPGNMGRREDLARWLTSNDHPLTARVIVNRLWQHHFGRGIVATPNDFGNMGQPPTHPELLDWLAVELVENEWSLKHVHRLMVTSAAYRQSSRISAADANHQRAVEVDGSNLLLWRANRRRLEAEAIRDGVLHVSGELNQRMGGESCRPALPDGVSKRYAWKPDAVEARQQRRSVYVFAKRNMRLPLFDAFDFPDMHNSCARRPETTTAPQALILLNSDLTRNTARRWAEKLVDRHGAELSHLVSAAYRFAFGRDADDDELAAARTFLAHHSRLVAVTAAQTADDRSESEEPPVEAVTDFCQAMVNANEFLYVD